MRMQWSSLLLFSFLHRHVNWLISLFLSRTHTHLHTPTHPSSPDPPPPPWRLPVRPLWHTALLNNTAAATAQHPCPPSSLPDWKYRGALNRRAACQMRANCLIAVGDVRPCVMRTVFSAPENQTLQPCQHQGRCIEKVSFKFSTAAACKQGRPFAMFIYFNNHQSIVWGTHPSN